MENGSKSERTFVLDLRMTEGGNERHLVAFILFEKPLMRRTYLQARRRESVQSCASCQHRAVVRNGPA